MTYAEMQVARAEYLRALEPAKKPRGATRAQLARRERRFGRCVYCGELFTGHTLQQTLDCANARS